MATTTRLPRCNRLTTTTASMRRALRFSTISSASSSRAPRAKTASLSPRAIPSRAGECRWSLNVARPGRVEVCPRGAHAGHGPCRFRRRARLALPALQALCAAKASSRARRSWLAHGRAQQGRPDRASRRAAARASFGAAHRRLSRPRRLQAHQRPLRPSHRGMPPETRSSALWHVSFPPSTVRATCTAKAAYYFQLGLQ